MSIGVYPAISIHVSIISNAEVNTEFVSKYEDEIL
jgi:hypothetical protein